MDMWRKNCTNTVAIWLWTVKITLKVLCQNQTVEHWRIKCKRSSILLPHYCLRRILEPLKYCRLECDSPRQHSAHSIHKSMDTLFHGTYGGSPPIHVISQAHIISFHRETTLDYHRANMWWVFHIKEGVLLTFNLVLRNPLLLLCVFCCCFSYSLFPNWAVFPAGTFGFLASSSPTWGLQSGV